MQAETAPAPSPWVELIRSLVPCAKQDFEAKFAKPITIDVKVEQTADGGRTPVFSFAFVKPGLLPTALERQWFDAYVAGFRRCCNNVLEMLDAAASGQVPS